MAVVIAVKIIGVMKILNSRFVIDEKTPVREGGMAEVICAFDNERGMQRVAIKLFRDGLVNIDYVLEAFSRECASLVELNSHPNVVKLIDYGTDRDSGRKFITLDWIEENLVEYLKQHPLRGWDDFYEYYGRGIIDALSFAYSREILHRDVKPQNVLLDDSRVVRVADFGISKFRKYYRPGITLSHFKSIPYTPEIDNEEFADSRDVFGYGVLALECLSPKPFDSYSDVYNFLDEADIPESVFKTLKRALEKEPQNRHANIPALYDEIESAQRTRRKIKKEKAPCEIVLTQSALVGLSADLNEKSTPKLLEFVLNDLNDECGVLRWRYLDSGIFREAPDHFAFITTEFRYQVAIQEDRRRLVIVRAFRSAPSALEGLRERAWNPHFEFRVAGRIPLEHAKDTIEQFVLGFDEHEAEQRIVAAKRAEGELFDKWANILRLKGDIEEQRERPINYKGFQVSGNRLTLNTDALLDIDVLDQPHLIRADERHVITGVIDSFSAETVTLFCDRPVDPTSVPREGALIFDTRLAQSALQRQVASLDAVRFDRSSRADLRKLLVGTQEPRGPHYLANIQFIQTDLDEDKRTAVAAALGVQDFLVVEGPPGTGKTKFITELILQHIRVNPRARILLSSQTHNALDNALEGVQQLAERNNIDVKLVRIGRRGDPRISPAVDDLLLENSLVTWLRSLNEKSAAFLAKWAKDNGIEPRLIEVGIALAELRLCNLAFAATEEDFRQLKEKLDALEAKEKDLQTSPTKGETYQEVISTLELYRRDYGKIEGDLRRQHNDRAQAIAKVSAFEEIGEEVHKLDNSDLESLEGYYIDHAKKGRQCRKLIDILQEWRERFGRSADFQSAFIIGCDVVAGTCVGFAGRGLQNVEFDLCIVDEASKATPTELLVPLSRCKKWIIVGDPLQLPPFLGEALENPTLLQKYHLTKDDAKATLLDHLIARLPPHSMKSLLRQHRMIRPIGELVSKCFYAGRLINVNDAIDNRLFQARAMPRPVTWFTTAHLSNRQETRSGGEYRNFAELEIIERFICRVQFAASTFNGTYKVALLSGYAGQVDEMKRMAARLHSKLTNLVLETFTVDAYQGREADLAVYSVTRSNEEGRIGFLRERERLNVALSRAKVGLAIVGDSHFCNTVVGNNPFADVIDYIRRHPDDCKIEAEVLEPL